MKKVKSGSDISFSFNVKVTDKTTVDEIIREASDIIKVRFAEYKVEPEESEDERVRKLIIDRVRSATEMTESLRELLLTYLEKQKEQKPVRTAKEAWKEMRLEVYAQASGNRHEPNYSDDSTKMFSLCDIDEIFEKIGDSTVGPQPAEKQDYSGLNDLERAIHRGFLSAGVENVPVTIIKETAKECLALKPAEWSEDYREEDIQTRFAFYTYKDDPSVLYLSNVFVEETSRNHGFGTRILKAAEKVAEAIGAITICLKVKQYSPANAWYRKRGYGYVAFEDGYDWLEKNLEYMKPVKQEWSEEYEKILHAIELHVGQLDSGETINGFSSSDMLRVLKSLRPQPHWKPSEEQMSILKAVKEYVGCSSGYWGEGLGSLIKDLEKQM